MISKVPIRTVGAGDDS